MNGTAHFSFVVSLLLHGTVFMALIVTTPSGETETPQEIGIDLVSLKEGTIENSPDRSADKEIEAKN